MSRRFASTGFARNVFVNCPFDEQYLVLLRPLLFTIIYLGFRPRIALEQLDSGIPRVQRIVDLIIESKYAIHDLSRLQASNAGEFYRLNMPFELGVDVGCRLFRPGKWAAKRCLVLETERYRYQAALSDMSNSDIAIHGDKPQNVVTEVRNWLNNQAGLRAPGPSSVWGAFVDFMTDNSDELRARGFSKRDIARLPVDECIDCMEQWVKSRRRRGR